MRRVSPRTRGLLLMDRQIIAACVDEVAAFNRFWPKAQMGDGHATWSSSSGVGPETCTWYMAILWGALWKSINLTLSKQEHDRHCTCLTSKHRTWSIPEHKAACSLVGFIRFGTSLAPLLLKCEAWEVVCLVCVRRPLWAIRSWNFRLTSYKTRPCMSHLT